MPIFPNFCNHQLVFSIIVRSPEIPYMDYNRKLSLIYRYVINLFVSPPIWKRPSFLMNVSVWDIVLLTNGFFEMANFSILTTFSLVSWCHFQLSVWKYSLSPLFHYNLLIVFSHGTLIITVENKECNIYIYIYIYMNAL